MMNVSFQNRLKRSRSRHRQGRREGVPAIGYGIHHGPLSRQGRDTAPAIFAVIPAQAGIQSLSSSPQRRRGFREQLKRRPSQKTRSGGPSAPALRGVGPENKGGKLALLLCFHGPHSNFERGHILCCRFELARRLSGGSVANSSPCPPRLRGEKAAVNSLDFPLTSL